MNHSLRCKTLFFLFLFIAYLTNLSAQTASGTITLQTEQNEPITHARVYIYSYDADKVLDSLLTDSQGTASFSELNLPTALYPDREKSSGITVYPNPGSAHSIIVSSTYHKENPHHATIYNLSGQPVAHLKPSSGSSDATVSFTWKPENRIADGLYLFRYGNITARINHLQNAPSVSGNRPTSNLKPETWNMKHGTSNTEQSLHPFFHLPTLFHR